MSRYRRLRDYTIDTTDWNWADSTHSDTVCPDYNEVFQVMSDGPDAKVLEFHIVFEYEDW